MVPRYKIGDRVISAWQSTRGYITNIDEEKHLIIVFWDRRGGISAHDKTDPWITPDYEYQFYKELLELK